MFRASRLVSLVLMSLAAIPGTTGALELTFTPEAVLASGVRPGGEVAWLGAGRWMEGPVSLHGSDALILLDDDGDGEVLLPMAMPLPASSAWAVVDLSTGELAVGSPGVGELGVRPLLRSSLQRGPDGRFSRFAQSGRRWMTLVARPGVGAWSSEVADGGEADADRSANGALHLALEQMAPLGRATAPTAFAARDVVVFLSTDDLSMGAAVLDRDWFPGTGLPGGGLPGDDPPGDGLPGDGPNRTEGAR